jgi:hypothetical protein
MELKVKNIKDIIGKNITFEDIQDFAEYLHETGLECVDEDFWEEKRRLREFQKNYRVRSKRKPVRVKIKKETGEINPKKGNVKGMSKVAEAAFSREEDKRNGINKRITREQLEQYKNLTGVAMAEALGVSPSLVSVARRKLKKEEGK